MNHFEVAVSRKWPNNQYLIKLDVTNVRKANIHLVKICD